MDKDATNRRKSNEGFRKVDMKERMLVFLSRIRRKVPFSELGYQYGCGKETARRYFDEMVDHFNTHLVPRLIFSPTPEELKKMSRAEVLEQYPDLLAILDATNWEQLRPENFVENRLTYSGFKHFNSFQVLLGKSPSIAVVLD